MDDWWSEALCRDFPQVWWFPEQGGAYQTAVFVCSMCPSREPCLDYAVRENIPHGIWGGLTEAGRRSARRKMAGRGRPVEGKQPRPADECRAVSDGIRRTEEAHAQHP